MGIGSAISWAVDNWGKLLIGLGAAIIGFKVLSGLATGLGTALATKLSGAGGAGGKGGGIFGSIGKAINSIKPQNVLKLRARLVMATQCMYLQKHFKNCYCIRLM